MPPLVVTEPLLPRSPAGLRGEGFPSGLEGWGGSNAPPLSSSSGGGGSGGDRAPPLFSRIGGGGGGKSESPGVDESARRFNTEGDQTLAAGGRTLPGERPPNDIMPRLVELGEDDAMAVFAAKVAAWVIDARRAKASEWKSYKGQEGRGMR